MKKYKHNELGDEVEVFEMTSAKTWELHQAFLNDNNVQVHYGVNHDETPSYSLHAVLYRGKPVPMAGHVLVRNQKAGTVYPLTEQELAAEYSRL